MALTPQQVVARRQYLGSSDAPAVLNVDPRHNACDVYLDKRGLADPFDGNRATERGAMLEPVLFDWCRKRLIEFGLPSRFRVNEMRIHSNGLLATNFDALAVPPDDGLPHESIECKTSGLFGLWGSELTDEVPDYVLVQVNHGFACVPSLQVCWVPVLLPGYCRLDFRLYRVERNPEAVQIVESAGVRFMQEHVLAGIMPKNQPPNMDLIKRLRRVANKTVEISAQAVERYERATAVMKVAKQIQTLAKRELLSELGDAEAGAFDGGLVEYFQHSRKAHEVAESEYRRVVIKRNNKAIRDGRLRMTLAETMQFVPEEE